MKKFFLFLFFSFVIIGAMPVSVLAEWATLCLKTSAGFELIQQDWIDSEINGNFCHYTDHWPVDGREIPLRLSDGELATVFDFNSGQIFCRVTDQPFSCEINKCSVAEVDMPGILTPQYSWFRILVEPGFNSGENFGYDIYRRIHGGEWVSLDNYAYWDTTLEVSIQTRQEAADGVVIPSGTYDFVVVPKGTAPEYATCVLSAQVNFRAERTSDIAWIYHDITYKRVKWWPENSSEYNTELKVNLYIPKGFSGPRPILIYLHPGGGALGDRYDLEGRYPLETMALLQALQQGMAVIIPDYSLNPGVNWDGSPQNAWNAMEDIDDLLRWLNRRGLWSQKNYQRFNLDPDNLVVTGTSFGGYLALMSGLLQGEIDSGYYHSEPLPVKHVIANSGFWNTEDWVPASPYIRAMIADDAAFYPATSIYDYMEERRKVGMWDAYNSLRIPEVDKFWFNPEFANRRRELSPSAYTDWAWKLESVQILHGRRDLIISYNQAVRATEDFRAIGYPTVLISHSGGHGASPTAFQKALDNIIQGK